MENEETNKILNDISTTGENAMVQRQQHIEATKGLETPLEGILTKVAEVAANTKENKVQKVVMVTPVKDVDDPEWNENTAGGLLWDMLRGPKGHTPIKGVDFNTDEDKKELINLVIPHVRPVKGVDYYTDAEQQKAADEIFKKVRVPIDGFTPTKGVDYTDGEKGEPGKDADDVFIASLVEEKLTNKLLPLIPSADDVSKLIPTPKDGKDGDDGSPDTGEQIVEKLEALEKGKRLSYDSLDDLPNLDTFRRSVSSKDYSTGDLTDVSAKGIVSGQVLQWNGKAFVPATMSGSGSVTSVTSANADIGVATTTTTPVLTLNSGIGAGQIVKLDGSAKLPAVDGSQLTHLPTGVTTFAALTDVPASYTGQSGKAVRVKTTEDGLEYFTLSGGTGTVTTVSVTTANGVSGTVANASTTPAITLTLGSITPTSVNGVTLSGSSTPTLAVTGTTTVSGSNTGDNVEVTSQTVGFTITKGATPKTLTVASDASISGSNTGDQTLAGLGGVSTSVTVNGHALTSNVTVTATDLSLGNVDNTSDATKNAATVTLTNKRITKRYGSTTTSATPTINTDSYDVYELTAQAGDISNFTTNLTGTPVNGDQLRIIIVGTGARAITWGTSFESSTVTLPTTTVGTAPLDVGFRWNSVSSCWRCVAVA